MPERGGEIGLAVESLRKPSSVAADRGDLQRIATRQPGMLGQVDLTHPAAPSNRTMVYPANVAPLVNGIPDSYRRTPTSARRFATQSFDQGASTAMAIYGWPIGWSVSTHV